MKMLLRANDELVPRFLETLEQNGQPHVARMLRAQLPGDLFHH